MSMLVITIINTYFYLLSFILKVALGGPEYINHK